MRPKAAVSEGWGATAGPPWGALPPAISNPARAGPAIIAAWNIVRFRASAPGRSAGGTRRGTSAWRAGLSKAGAAAWIALSREIAATGARRGNARAARPTEATVIA